MTSRTKTTQLWRCPRCNYEYRPALPATEVLCPSYHPNLGRGRGGKALMVLIEGDPPKPTRKKTS